jgi:type III secretion protein F
MATSVSFSDIETKVGGAVSDLESALQQKITGMTTQPTTADLLDMQQAMQKWSMLVELQATLVKTVCDTMKGVISKSG